jgi:hypothetical protein
VQLASGRLVLPLCHHANEGGKFDGAGTILCYRSDDDGQTWRRGKTERQAVIGGKRFIAQEPLVIERKDKSLLLLARSNEGSQLQSTSTDGGDTWSDLAPSSIKSPLSPASIERLPSGDLLLIWNDHSQIDPALRGKRTPLSAAISTDDGLTWQPSHTLFDNPTGWYCYTAIEVVGEHVLLAHCAGDIHNPKGSGTVLKRLPPGEAYDIPLRCLLPQGLEDILVAGRCLSGTHEAHSSYRVMPIVMATGQAAGVCAAIAAARRLPPRDVPVPEVQATLVRQGADLGRRP